jgi:hypothetical protein
VAPALAGCAGCANGSTATSINIFHYAGTGHLKAAEADTKRMIELGVEYFQIDSPYDVWLR